MHYKGYDFGLTGVYKIKNNKKLYMLRISKEKNIIFESDYIYENEKRAFKDAKEMINKSRFDTEIIIKNNNKEKNKTDDMLVNKKINKFVTKVLIITTILMAVAYSITILGISKVAEDFQLFVILYSVFGILMALVMLFWGVFSNGGFELNDKQIKIYRMMHKINSIVNNVEETEYDEQPFKDKEKGWYSSSSLIALLFESLFGIFIIVSCIMYDSFGLTFYGVITSYTLLIINYTSSVLWEISDAKIKGEGFPFKRVITPLIVIAIIIIIFLICMI